MNLKSGLSALALAAAMVLGASAALRAAEEGPDPAYAHRAPSQGSDADDEVGRLNPQELGIDYWIARSKEARYDAGMCMYGYPIAKMGWHEEARRIFERCAEHGNLSAMAWSAWTEENGYDLPSNPVAAAAWDQRLADTGSSLGQFNYGLDILRGHGVTQDRALGKSYIDKASAGGDATAKELAQHDYDPESVTPTADLAHYRKPQF